MGELKQVKYKRPEAFFITSSAYYKQLPTPKGEEFAIIGRSNVGKSSFINHVLENNALAKTSKTPGKTSLANLYQINESMVWVDLPGYGYARASGDEKTRWSRLIADYCTKRPNLLGIFWLIDIRHIGIKADQEAFIWLKSLSKPIFPILTKADKLTSSQRIIKRKTAVEIFGFSQEPIIYSVLDHSSRERFWESFDSWRKSL